MVTFCWSKVYQCSSASLIELCCGQTQGFLFLPERFPRECIICILQGELPLTHSSAVFARECTNLVTHCSLWTNVVNLHKERSTCIWNTRNINLTWHKLGSIQLHEHYFLDSVRMKMVFIKQKLFISKNIKFLGIA